MSNLADESSLSPKGRILVVDDEEPIREIICGMLSRAGYEHQNVASGADALAILRAGGKFDLLLSGLMMPEMDGLQLMEHVQRDYPGLTTVFVTSVSDAVVMEEAFRRGAAGYLFKPFDRGQLLELIREAFRCR